MYCFLPNIVNVYYVTNFGCIEGVLTVNSDVVLFDPSFVERNKELVSKCNSIIYLIILRTEHFEFSGMPDDRRYNIS